MISQRFATAGAIVALGLIASAHAQTASAPDTAAAAKDSTAAAAGVAAPTETAEALLKRVDTQMNSFKDGDFLFKMIIKEPSGRVEREIEFATQQRNQKRLVRFLAPGDIKGMGFLLESADVMYALLPAFGNRVRRVATHQMSGSFMGSDLNNDDMAILEFSPSFTPKYSSQEGDTAIVDLAIKPGRQTEFPHLKLWIDRKAALISKIEYYDASGKKLRTQLRQDYAQDNKAGNPPHFSPGKMIFIDHRRNDHQTELLTTKHVLDSGISEELFTVRALQRG